jgi:hypothetical protein
MARKPSRSLLAAALMAAAAPALPAPAQAAPPPRPAAPAAADTGLVYRREVFQYQPVGRPDPFRPLLTAADMGIRAEDLRLTAVVYNPNPRLSVAVFARGDGGSLRVRVGQRLGNLTVVGIYPRRVDVRVEEFGVGRVQSMTLQRQPFAPVPSQPAADAGAPQGAGNGAPTVVVTPPAQTPAQPTGPLQRGGRRPAAPTATPATQPAPASAQSRPPTYP